MTNYRNRIPSTKNAIRSDVRTDRDTVTVSIFYGVLMSILFGAQYLLFDTYSPFPFLCLLVFFIHLTWIRHSLSDPFSLLLLFAFIYSAFPLFFGVPGSWSALKFGFDGAAKIYAVGSIAVVFGVALATTLIPGRPSPLRAQQGPVKPDTVSRNAGIFCALVSLPLTAIFIMRHGTVLFGGISYADSFEAKMTAGSGLLNLATPFAAAGVAFLLCSHVRLRSSHHALAFLPYLALFAAYGQRKFLIYPAVFYTVRYLRIPSLPKLFAGLLACAASFVVIMYLGFLRSTSGGVSQGLNPNMVGSFASTGNEKFGGETIPVFATASAAYSGFIRALPLAGDYWRSWMMAIPHFLVPRNTFESVNERFAHTYMASSQATGMGWGFSFFGEAYLIGGYALVVVATLAMMLFFRWLYVAGGRDRRSGLLGAISLVAIPFTFWFQRNAFAFFVKEFLIVQVAIVLLGYYFISLLMRATRPRTRTRTGFPAPGAQPPRLPPSLRPLPRPFVRPNA